MIVSTSDFQRIIGLTIAASLILSGVAIVSNPVLNSDPVLYLQTADAFSVGGMQAAKEVYAWPFLSILIATLKAFTGFSTLVCAQLLTALFFASTCAAFVMITRELGGDRTTCWLAAFSILLFPTLSEYRHYIIRDSGYWAMIMLSMWAMLRYTCEHKLKYALTWFMFVCMGVLFRVEGIIVLVLTPLALLLNNNISWKTRAIMALKPYSIVAIVAICFVGLLHADNASLTARLGSLLTNLPTLAENAEIRLDSMSTALQSVIPHKAFAEDASLILIFGTIAVTLSRIIASLYASYLALFAYNMKINVRMGKPEQRAIIWAYCIAALCGLSIIAFTEYFASKRYSIQACLPLLLWIPFILSRLLIDLKGYRHKSVAYSILTLIILYTALDPYVSSGASKQHISQATDWLKKNVNNNTKLLTNDEHIGYFSGAQSTIASEPDISTLLQQPEKISQEYDMVAVIVHRKTHIPSSSIISNEKLKIAEFHNERRDAVYIIALE